MFWPLSALVEKIRPEVPYVESKEHYEAADLYGLSSFHGVRLVALTFDVKKTQSMLDSLEVIPYQECTLKSCRNTHVLFPAFALTLRQICWATQRIEGAEWFWPHDFATKKAVQPTWYLVRKEISHAAEQHRAMNTAEVAFASILFPELLKDVPDVTTDGYTSKIQGLPWPMCAYVSCRGRLITVDTYGVKDRPAEASHGKLLVRIPDLTV